MKIYVDMKAPDTMHDAVQEAVEEEVKRLGLPADEAQALVEMRTEEECAKMAQWFEYGEYLGVDFDTETMTAVVREQKR